MLVNALWQRTPLCNPPEVFYSCRSINFRGCCTHDPCTLGVCPSSPDNNDENEDNSERNESQTLTEVLDVITTSMTDSGITHTVPNDEIVTITRHTTVVTDRSARPTPTPEESTSSASITSGLPATLSSAAASTRPPGESASSEAVSAEGSANPLSTGAIIGVGVGGGIALALLAIAIFVMRRHSKLSREHKLNSGGADGPTRDDLVEEKHFPTPMSAHTTGTRRDSDPFAPFGGRADADPYRPQSGVFEMDATSAPPVELPVTSQSGGSATHAAASREPQASLPPPANARPQVMAANLDGLGTNAGHPAHINHWNQLRDSSGH